MTKHDRAGRIAGRQHGLITRNQAQQVGFTSSTIQRMRTNGLWTTTGTGVYAVAGAPRTWHQRVLARCLELDAVASHRTAAVLLEVSGFRPGPIEVTVHRNTKLSRSGHRVHESLDFRLIRPILVHGIATTPPARLAVDLGSVVSFERYEAAIDQLIGRRSVTWDDLFRTLVIHARRGRNGVGALRALLDVRFGSEVGDSVLEHWFLREVRRHGLPVPVTQLPIHDGETFLARVDVAFVEHRVIVELDGLAFHLNRTSFSADPKTRNRLRRMGWFVLEITWDMLADDLDAVFADLAALLDERAPKPPIAA